MRRLLITQRLFGTKVGPVWVIYQEDLETFRRLRRPPGRPRRAIAHPASERDGRERIDSERLAAGTGGALRGAHRGKRSAQRRGQV